MYLKVNNCASRETLMLDLVFVGPNSRQAKLSLGYEFSERLIQIWESISVKIYFLYTLLNLHLKRGIKYFVGIGFDVSSLNHCHSTPKSCLGKFKQGQNKDHCGNSVKHKKVNRNNYIAAYTKLNKVNREQLYSGL